MECSNVSRLFNAFSKETRASLALTYVINLAAATSSNALPRSSNCFYQLLFSELASLFEALDKITSIDCTQASPPSSLTGTSIVLTNVDSQHWLDSASAVSTSLHPFISAQSATFWRYILLDS